MRYLVSAMLILVALIHLLPVSGVLGAERLSSLYGIAVTEPNIAILMRHRAVLFGLLGLFMLIAAFKPSFQPAAFVAGFVSVASFLWIASAAGGYNVAIGRVVAVDIFAVGCLLLGAAAYAYGHRAS